MKRTKAPIDRNPLPKKVTFSLNLVDVEIDRLEISKRVHELEKPLVKEDYEFQFEVNMRLIPDEKLAILTLVVTLFEKQDKIVKIELAKLITKTTIKITNFEEVIMKVGNQLMYPETLFPTFVGLCVSTARGIFLSLVKDMKIKNALIPIIDPKIFSQELKAEIINRVETKEGKPSLKLY